MGQFELDVSRRELALDPEDPMRARRAQDLARRTEQVLLGNDWQFSPVDFPDVNTTKAIRPGSCYETRSWRSATKEWGWDTREIMPEAPELDARGGLTRSARPYAQLKTTWLRLRGHDVAYMSGDDCLLGTFASLEFGDGILNRHLIRFETDWVQVTKREIFDVDTDRERMGARARLMRDVAMVLIERAAILQSPRRVEAYYAPTGFVFWETRTALNFSGGYLGDYRSCVAPCVAVADTQHGADGLRLARLDSLYIHSDNVHARDPGRNTRVYGVDALRLSPSRADSLMIRRPVLDSFGADLRWYENRRVWSWPHDPSPWVGDDDELRHVRASGERLISVPSFVYSFHVLGATQEPFGPLATLPSILRDGLTERGEFVLPVLYPRSSSLPPRVDVWRVCLQSIHGWRERYPAEVLRAIVPGVPDMQYHTLDAQRARRRPRAERGIQSFADNQTTGA